MQRWSGSCARSTGVGGSRSRRWSRPRVPWPDRRRLSDGPVSDDPIVVIRGPPGSGKTTLGRALAARTGWAFADGDDLHPAANIAKMKAGVPLTDADRAPWLARIGAVIDDWRAAGVGGVVACSALKRRYR